MSFPTSPSNGDVITVGLYRYRFNATLGTWDFAVSPRLLPPNPSAIPTSPSDGQIWQAGGTNYKRDNTLGVWNMLPPGGSVSLTIAYPLIYNPYVIPAAGFIAEDHGPQTNHGGSVFPSKINGQEIDALIQEFIVYPSAPNGDFVIAIKPNGLQQDHFHSVTVPGLNGGSPLLTSNVYKFGNIASYYNVTFWQWESVPGVIISGNIQYT